jgi:glycosyltransferase involved in cell wall biosynthesis
MLSPEITVITPYRDAACFLNSLVHTLQSQTFEDWECILIDHASLDNGYRLAQELTAGDSRFVHLQLSSTWMQHRQLPAIPRNYALGFARAELITFLDVDDILHPERFERQLAFHRSHALEVSVSAYMVFDNCSESILSLRTPPRATEMMREIWRRNPFPMITTLVNRELLHSGFPLVPHEDYLLWLTLICLRPDLRYGCLPQVLGFYRKHATNLSRRPHELVRWTYGVYRSVGLGRAISIVHLMRWMAWHCCRVLRELIDRHHFAKTVSQLLDAAPITLDA